ncbi:periplasmic heavy metal sensor [Azospirillum sp. ST 5-10]|uniref:periplasmic heavy metal sensor n=1 Tax=unclassified Azospirillum TaxID=2630922 RepID=UPI003F4A4C15
MSVTTVGRRWPWYLLIASLAANMLLIGIFVGQLMHWGPPPPPPPGPERRLAHFVDRVAEVLSPADASVLRETFEAKRSLLRQQEDNRDALRRAVERALSGDTYDAQALADAFARFHAADDELSRQVDAAVVDVLGRLSAEGRQTLADFRFRGP